MQVSFFPLLNKAKTDVCLITTLMLTNVPIRWLDKETKIWHHHGLVVKDRLRGECRKEDSSNEMKFGGEAFILRLQRGESLCRVETVASVPTGLATALPTSVWTKQKKGDAGQPHFSGGWPASPSSATPSFLSCFHSSPHFQLDRSKRPLSSLNSSR